MAILSALNGIATWYRPDGPLTPDASPTTTPTCSSTALREPTTS